METRRSTRQSTRTKRYEEFALSQEDNSTPNLPATRTRKTKKVDSLKQKAKAKDKENKKEKEAGSLLQEVLAAFSLELPSEILHREKEHIELVGQISSFLESRIGRPVYLSGMPGTGKTATVRNALEVIQSGRNGSSIEICFLNAQSFSNPNSVYTAILKTIDPKMKRVEPTKAMSELKKKLASKAKKTKLILIVDEIDKLLRKNQTIIYNLLELLGPRMMLITMSNTMALLERLAPKIASRMGYASIQFFPYSEEQLTEILKSRFSDIHNLDFNSQALTYLAKSVASQTGDMRRALALARRAVEISAFNVTAGKIQVRMPHVSDAAKELFGWDFAMWLPQLTTIQKQFLQCLVFETKRLNEDEENDALPKLTGIEKRLRTMRLEDSSLGAFVTKERCMRLAEIFADSGLLSMYYVPEEDEFAIVLQDGNTDIVESDMQKYLKPR